MAPRLDKSEHPKKRAFLASYAECGNISTACKAAGIARATYYLWTEHDADFSAAAAQALIEAGDKLEEHARAWATTGVATVKEVYERDDKLELQLVKREESRDISPTLLIFLLKGAKPEKYRERLDVAHSGAVVKVMDQAAWDAI